MTTQTTQEKNQEILEGLQLKSLCFSISENLHNKLVNHFNHLRINNYKRLTKSQWVCEAIYEKLEKKIQSSLHKQQRIHLKIPKRALDEIDAQIQILKKLHVSYSKKKWIMEAIYEKLDRESKGV